jgi:hypothetical protein
MTQDEIIDMARWSGLGMLLEVGGMDKCLEHFAKLVAVKERARCSAKAEIALLGEHIWTRDRVLKAIRLEDEE